MQINVSELREAPREIEIHISPAELQLAAEGFVFRAPVTGRVRFQMVGKRILAQGYLETHFETACVRCLSQVEHAIRASVEVLFEKRPSTRDKKETELETAWEAESHEIDYYDEDLLDPTEPFRQMLLLELPGHPLCSHECRGLCPQCGADLNHGDCACGTAVSVPIGESDWKARLKKIHLTPENERS